MDPTAPVPDDKRCDTCGQRLEWYAVGAAIACVAFGHARWSEHGEGLQWFVVAIVLALLAAQSVLPTGPWSVGLAALLVLVAPLRRSTIAAVAVVFVVGCAHIPDDVSRHVVEFVLCAALCAAMWAVMRRSSAVTPA